MKKFTMLFALALAVAACSTDYTPESGNPDKVTLSFRTSMPLTKAVTGSGDMTLDRFQVFVFDAEGYLEANTSVITSLAQGLPSLELTPGIKDIWAVGNAPDLFEAYDIETEDDFFGIRVDVLDQVNGQGLYYSASLENSSVYEDNTVDLAFDHLACKVIIDKIERNFYNPDLAQVPMHINKIYLSNVAADCNFACTGNPEGWYNKKGVIDKDDDIVCYMFAYPGFALAQGASYNLSHTFYAFPNPVTNDTYGGNGWTPRRTRLIVECSINGEPCYYPITLPSDANATLTRNTVYHISKLTLRCPGTPDPDDPTGTVDPYMDYQFDVIVNDWLGGDSYTETFD